MQMQCPLSGVKRIWHFVRKADNCDAISRVRLLPKATARADRYRAKRFTPENGLSHPHSKRNIHRRTVCAREPKRRPDGAQGFCSCRDGCPMTSSRTTTDDGNQPMTAAQAGTLKRLAQDTYELDAFKPNLTRAEAEKRIITLTAKLKLLGEPPHTL